jgi:enterochelin esterase-like enzyme
MSTRSWTGGVAGAVVIILTAGCAPVPGPAAPTGTGTASTDVPSTVVASTATAPGGTAGYRCTEAAGHVDALTFTSTTLAVDQPVQRYLVYTPPCYQLTAGRYPTVYLLHGAQTDEHQWEQIGLFTAADRLIAAGTIPAMMFVLPDAIWAMGTYDGDPPPLDRLVIGELIPAVERSYRVRLDQPGRAIGGISRGGEWALLLAGRHPDLFVAVGGHSPAVGAPGTPNSLLVPLLSTPRTQHIWLDVGRGDTLAGPVETFSRGLDAAGTAHEMHTGDGGHDRRFWSSQIETYLRFYSRAVTAT